MTKKLIEKKIKGGTPSTAGTNGRSRLGRHGLFHLVGQAGTARFIWRAGMGRLGLGLHGPFNMPAMGHVSDIKLIKTWLFGVTLMWTFVF